MTSKMKKRLGRFYCFFECLLPAQNSRFKALVIQKHGALGNHVYFGDLETNQIHEIQNFLIALLHMNLKEHKMCFGHLKTSSKCHKTLSKKVPEKKISKKRC